jgi:hypothetical protein
VFSVIRFLCSCARSILCSTGLGLVLARASHLGSASDFAPVLHSASPVSCRLRSRFSLGTDGFVLVRACTRHRVSVVPSQTGFVLHPVRSRVEEALQVFIFVAGPLFSALRSRRRRRVIILQVAGLGHALICFDLWPAESHLPGFVFSHCRTDFSLVLISSFVCEKVIVHVTGLVLEP